MKKSKGDNAVIAEFLLQSPAKPHMAIRLRYENGYLESVIGLATIAPAVSADAVLNLKSVYYHEATIRQRIAAAAEGGVVITELIQDATHVKIGVWCLLWKAHYGEAYKPTVADTNAVKQLRQIDADLVKLYLSQGEVYPFGGKCLKGYVSCVNALEALRAKPKPRFADEWTPEQAAKYNGKELQEYYKHLCNIGWVTTTIGTGQQVWRKGGSDA